jgi:hypothetical protein
MTEVLVYPMLVLSENETWPEMDQRTRQRMSLKSALQSIRNKEIRRILKAFAGQLEGR